VFERQARAGSAGASLQSREYVMLFCYLWMLVRDALTMEFPSQRRYARIRVRDRRR